MPQDTPSARGRRSIPAVESCAPPPQFASSKDGSRAHIHSITDKTEYIKQLKTCWVQKTSGSPSRALISWWPTARTTHIWSWATCSWYLMLSKHDCKVNLYALEALQKIITLLRDNLAQVLYILVPAIVDNHLNSKNNAIYMATRGAIQALINNLDNTTSTVLHKGSISQWKS
ncbi:uncharacterized protein LOC143484418 [Brachyhypopomus gauderio]|uniref:uncharacterized protein LOC143484418 n=1 Tax=Brachyhypopomus gauderio TaxID=698409 RepID=UPI004041071D